MGSIDQIVQVNITQQTQAVPQAGFGIPLIVGSSNRFTGGDLIRYYASSAAMLEDGFLTSDPEYIYAVKAFSQALSPVQIGVGYSTFANIAADLLAIQNQSDLWYGVSLCTQNDAVILAAASFIETEKKIYISDSAEAGILTSATSDVLSQLKALGYKRTALMYSTEANQGPSAAWLGGQLPQTPGSSTWKFKQMIGIAPDDLTQTQLNNVIGIPGIPQKNGNVYVTVGGVPITEEGWMVGGQFIDITVGLDWLESRMQENVFSLLVQSPKVPYTDQGISVIVNAVRQTLQEGVQNGLIDGNSDITVTAPSVQDIPQADRANRVLPDVKFSCRLAGAIHFVVIDGTVSV